MNVTDKPMIPDSISFAALNSYLPGDLGKMWAVVLIDDPKVSLAHVVKTIVEVIPEIPDANTASKVIAKLDRDGRVTLTRATEERAKGYVEKLVAAGLTAKAQED